ncbi:conserved hypothetical protein [Culex quinquefasciatus]|uniref:Uncharacterized protein n=1 Tax=Culex quinquefasciatus TaxID=7176 RepID=B0X9X0_CULQU|nr:conserved hypothetical protein [Culex quinquefasciatus]|eukprot:XP_001866442.1 conserved hypothetical protein [Culex quinquefasciatus]
MPPGPSGIEPRPYWDSEATTLTTKPPDQNRSYSPSPEWPSKFFATIAISLIVPFVTLGYDFPASCTASSSSMSSSVVFALVRAAGIERGVRVSMLLPGRNWRWLRQIPATSQHGFAGKLIRQRDVFFWLEKGRIKLCGWDTQGRKLEVLAKISDKWELNPDVQDKEQSAPAAMEMYRRYDSGR